MTQPTRGPAPAPQRSMNKVWIWALVIIVAIWIIYAVTGGPSTPPSETAADSAPVQQR
jgi:hypothetical protein